MKNKNIENKLKAYTALAAGVIAVGSNVNAQIMYIDVVPDSIVSDTAYALDLNNDNIADFEIVQFGYNTSTSSNPREVVRVDAYSNGNFNKILTDIGLFTSTTGSVHLAKALNNNDIIDGIQTIWNTWDNIMNAQGSMYGKILDLGYWKDVKDKYLGLKFQINGQWHYGWARLDVDAAATSFTIKDYAYNSVPNQGILAGDTSGFYVNVKENISLDNISVYSHNKTLFVDFKDNNITDGVIKLYNIMGQEIKSIPVNNTTMEIDLKEIPYDICFIKVLACGKILTKKMIL